MGEKIIWSTEDELEFLMRRKNSQLGLLKYYQAALMRRRWDRIDRNVVLSKCESLLK